jgi:hypothetical protein
MLVPLFSLARLPTMMVHCILRTAVSVQHNCNWNACKSGLSFAVICLENERAGTCNTYVQDLFSFK